MTATLEENMKRVLLAVVFLSQGLSLSAQAGNPDEQDIEVIFPPELNPSPPPTEEQRRHDDLIRKLNANLPYRNDWAKQGSTLGVLCRISDAVIVGRIDQAGVSDTNQFKRSIKIAVETNVFGRVPGLSVSVDAFWRLGLRELSAGERALVFLSGRLWGAEDYARARRWDFDVPSVPKDASGNFYLRGNDRNIVAVGGPEEERAYLDAVAGYMKCLRGTARDPEAYYLFLCGLMKSSIPRIREDARQDMLYLIRSRQEIDLDRILKDGNIDEGIKDYVRLYWKPWREGKQMR